MRKSRLVAVASFFAACWVVATGCGGNASSPETDPAPASEGGSDDATVDTGVDARQPGPDAATDSGDASQDANSSASDAGDAADGDAGPPAPPWVSLEYMLTCPDVVTCDVDPSGAWTITGGCFSGEIFTTAKQQCAGLLESNVVARARGLFDFTAMTTQRKLDIEMSAHLSIPTVCAQGFSCPTLGIILTTPAGGSFDTAVCVAGAGSTCECDVADSNAEDVAANYTYAGGVVTTDEVPERTFDYCVDMNELRLHETSQGLLRWFTFTAAP